MSDDTWRRLPIVATVTLTPIGGDMQPAADATVFTLDHEANAEVCVSVMRMLERRFPIGTQATA